MLLFSNSHISYSMAIKASKSKLSSNQASLRMPTPKLSNYLSNRSMDPLEGETDILEGCEYFTAQGLPLSPVP